MGAMNSPLRGFRKHFWFSKRSGAAILGLAFTSAAFLHFKNLSETTMSSFAEVRENYQASDLQVRDRNNFLLTEVRRSNKYRNLSWIELSEVSENFLSVLIQSEDKNFYSHQGVDLKALGAALWQRIFFNSKRGASTLTMQLSNLIHPNLKKKWTYKLDQIFLALEYEKKFTKSQILEIYVNAVQFRGEFQGLRSAALAFFKKEPRSLNKIESFILSAMIRSPNAGWPQIQTRACKLAHSLFDCDLISKNTQLLTVDKYSIERQTQWAYQLGLKIQKDLDLSGTESEQPKNKTPKKNAANVNSVKTTLDFELQRFIADRVQNQVLELADKNVKDAAVLVIENKSGEVLAYVASNPSNSETFSVDHIQAYRQAGSTLKPFMYAAAFEEGVLTPNSWLEDRAIDVVYDTGIYRPRNHDKQFSGWVQAKTALASSLNIPAVRVFELLPENLVHSKLSQMHFSKLSDASYYGPGLALGVADVKLWDLANGYRTLANLGLWTPLQYLNESPLSPSLAKPVRVFSEKSSLEVLQVLSKSENRAKSFGLNSILDTNFPSFVKTGTSKDMRDNWTVGSSRDFTVGVWVGNSSGESMWNVMGVSGAAPLWNQVITWLHEHRQDQSSWSAIENSLTTEPIEIKQERLSKAKITYPSNNSILAYDPDIPAKNQKLPLTYEGKNLDLHWRINEKVLDAKTQQVLWPIQRGRFKIELLSGEKIVDSVQILIK